MSWIKSQEDIAILKEEGARHAEILEALRSHVRPGVSTHELDQIAYRMIKESKDTPAFLNYKPEGAPTSFPASLCVSVNEEVVHGIPREDRILKEGDIVSVDLGIRRGGRITDAAITIPVGNVSRAVLTLVRATEEALYAGIEQARSGNHIGDIGFAISKIAKQHGYGVIRELGGHGVGHDVHEDPFVPNYGSIGKGYELEPGMVLALEPMFTLGSRHIGVLEDGYTIVTKDHSWSAHFEHTIVITEGDPLILTSS